MTKAAIAMRLAGVMALSLLAASPVAARAAKHASDQHAQAAPPPSEASGKGAAEKKGDDADQPPPEADGLRPEVGPKAVDLGNNLTLQLPAGYVFFDKANARKLLERTGNRPDDDTAGIITREEASWWILVSYENEGYVKDDDAAKMDNDEILKAIQEGTEEANKYRQEHGFSPVHVDGWTESPRYDKAVHHLVWAIKGTSSKGSSVNFNTRVLGRYGYASLNLIDSQEGIDASKPEVQKMLAATTFNKGARYEDVDIKKDKIAEYGLAALVAGGAGAAALKLVKIGLLAKFGGKLIALIIAGKKAIVLLLLAIGAGVKKLLGMKKRDAAVSAAASTAPTPPADPPPSDPVP